MLVGSGVRDVVIWPDGSGVNADETVMMLGRFDCPGINKLVPSLSRKTEVSLLNCICDAAGEVATNVIVAICRLSPLTPGVGIFPESWIVSFAGVVSFRYQIDMMLPVTSVV